MGTMRAAREGWGWRANIVAAWLLLAGGAALPARADVRLARILGDNMVLQRDVPVSVWGWADAGEKVTVQFAGQTAEAVAGPDGRWKATLKALAVNATPQDMTVAGKNTLAVRNLLVGDVWLCSGQSNMEWGLGGCNAPEDVQSANFPLIRWVRVPLICAESPQADIRPPHAPRWAVCEPGNAGGCSAVGFYFARKVHQETGVPIGVLVSSVGGTNIEKWMPKEAFESDPALADLGRQIARATAEYRVDVSNALDRVAAWIAGSRAALQAGQPLPEQPDIPKHPFMPGSKTNGPWVHLYNGMIHPLVDYAIRGALWYQGEANGGEGDSYFEKQRVMLEAWRRLWGREFPFYFVQLANFQKPNDNPAGGDGWARVRMAQLKTLQVPHTGIAVAIDLADEGNPDDIHPKNKCDVGERLARWALKHDYGKDVVVSGPLYKGMQIEGGKIRIAFDHVGGGLMAGKKVGRSPTAEEPGAALRRFAIAGEDRKWVWADAAIAPSTGSGQAADTVVVSSPQVPSPVAVRYAYSMNPDGANLYNREGLPASPFRTDAW